MDWKLKTFGQLFKDFMLCLQKCILGEPGADSTGKGKSKRAEKYGSKKSKERREEPLRTMSYQTSSKRSPPFWLLIGQRTQKFSGTNQKSERRRPSGTGLVRHCPQGLFSPFFTFLRAIFFRPFRLSLAPTICPWVSEDGGKLGLWLGKFLCLGEVGAYGIEVVAYMRDCRKWSFDCICF